MYLKRFTLFISILFFNLISTSSWTQGRVIGNVEGSVETYVNSNGYLTVYEEEGQKGKLRNYTIDIMDFYLDKVLSTRTELFKNTSTLSAAVNDEACAIAFINMVKDFVVVRSFGKNGGFLGEIKLEKVKTLSEQYAALFTIVKIYEAKDGFFILAGIESHDINRYAFEIIKVDNSMNELWRKRIGRENKAVYHKDILVDHEGNLLITYQEGRGMKESNFSQHVIKINDEGQTMFDQQYSEGLEFVARQVKTYGDEVMLFGQYIDENRNLEGLFVKVYNHTGNLVKDVKYNWKNEITSLIDPGNNDELEKIQKSEQYIFNDVVKTEKGYKIIAETFESRHSIGSTGSKIKKASSSLSLTNFIKFGSFVVVEINKSLGIEGVQVVKNDAMEIMIPKSTDLSQLGYYSMVYDMSHFRYVDKLENRIVFVFQSTMDGVIPKASLCATDISNDDEYLENESQNDVYTNMGFVTAFGYMTSDELGKITLYYRKKNQIEFTQIELL